MKTQTHNYFQCLTFKTIFYLSFIFYHPKIRYYLQQFKNTNTFLAKLNFQRITGITKDKRSPSELARLHRSASRGGEWIKAGTGFRYQLWEKLQTKTDIAPLWGRVKCHKGTQMSENQDDVQRNGGRGEHKDTSCSELTTRWTHMIYSRFEKGLRTSQSLECNFELKQTQFWMYH